MKCKICGQEVHNKGYGSHLKLHNMNAKEYYDKYLKKEGEDICPYCEGKNNFISITQGYRKHCSVRCSSLDEEVKAKLRATNKERYGYEYSAQRQEVKDKMAETNKERYGGVAPSCSKEVQEKTKQTWKQKYGVDHPMRNEEIKEKLENYFLETLGAKSPLENEEIFEKTRKTLRERYGVGNPTQSKVILERSKQTWQQKYGVNHPMKNEEIKNKVFDSYIKNNLYMESLGYIKMQDLIDVYGYGFRNRKEIMNKTVKYKDTLYMHKDKLYLIEEYIDNVKKGSVFEKDVVDFILSFYVGKIERNSRKIISPKELDIYIPDKKIAIECNGLYYHSENFGIEKYYHLNKTEMCNKKGINLIHINENDWEYNKDICKSIIKKSLGFYDYTIDTNECEIKKVENNEIKNFLNINHLKGYIKSDINIGLYYNNNLIQTISLNKIDNSKYELLRYCSLLNYNIIDGFEKSLNYFINNYNKEILTYVDRRKYNLNEYYNIGWELVSYTEPDYHFYRNKIKYEKENFKDVKNLLNLKNFNPNLPIDENLMNNCFFKVYDCGNAILKYTKI